MQLPDEECLFFLVKWCLLLGAGLVYSLNIGTKINKNNKNTTNNRPVKAILLFYNLFSVQFLFRFFVSKKIKNKKNKKKERKEKEKNRKLR